MPTIDELRAEVEKERGLVAEHEERNSLQRELNELRAKRNSPKSSKFKPFVEGTKKAFNVLEKNIRSLQEGEIQRDRQNKAIIKRGFVEPRRGIFG